MRKEICYIICEDNNDYRESLVAFLDEDEDLVCCGSFAGAENIVDIINENQPDVVLMDIDMPGKNGIEALKEIKEISSKTEIVMLTVFEDRDNVFEAVCAGASGYLLKNATPELIARSIKEVMKGGACHEPCYCTQNTTVFSKAIKTGCI
jgi:DNA-binding NarL/FixJ family response regulator